MLYYQGGTPPTTQEDIVGSYLKTVNAPLTDFTSNLKDFGKTIQTFETEMGKVVKTMGIGAQNGMAIKRSFNESYNQVVDLGGTLGDVISQQEALTEVTGRNLFSLQSQSKELFAAVSVTGLKADVLTKSFYDAGMETAHIAENVLEIVQTSNSLGVSAQAVSKVVTDNLDKLNRFGFTNGVEGLSKMAGKAAALRFDVGETFGLAEDLMSPDKAIEIAAAVQRLGGAATALTDPLRLMDLAQNDVEGLQQELGKLSKQYTYFNEETQSFQIMPGARRQLNEVASALGIERKEFEKMALETAKLDKKMSQMTSLDLGVSDEDKELLANLAQLETDKKTGTKEYVVNYKVGDEMVSKKLSDIDSGQLAIIKNQMESQTTGADPQEKLVNIADKQLTEFSKLVIAQEKIQNLMQNTLATTKGGEEFLKGIRESYETTADGIKKSFGPGSDFEKNMNSVLGDSANVTKLLRNLVTGDLAQVGASMASLATLIGTTGANFIEGQMEAYKNAIANFKVDKVSVSAAYAEIKSKAEEAIGFRDGFRKPMGDSLKTPEGEYDIYEKDYMLIATKLPEVLQKSSETGLKNVLSNKMGDISNIISGALKSVNVNNTTTNTTLQKQEVVHNVNFKVSVDGPRNKLSDMLIEELPKNPALMQYIVKHFKDTKSSGGFT